MTTEIAARIRESLLESAYVGQVLQVTAGSTDAAPLVGIRLSVANVPSLADLPPVLAEIRGLARQAAGDNADVYVEIDVTGTRSEGLSTEAIVIRGAD